MRLLLVLTCALMSYAQRPTATLRNDCMILLRSNLSQKFNETIAHAIHSMTVQGLRMFKEDVTEHNNIPTVNHNLNDVEHLVLDYAPDVPLPQDFVTVPMQMIDKILSTTGLANDGLGPNWSPVERIVHHFHMLDLWNALYPTFEKVVKQPPSYQFCQCLNDTKSNGIYRAVEWIAEHYRHGTPITLLNKPIPKLVDANSWTVWKNRLLYYYTQEAFHDAATYLFCATR